MIDTLGYDTVRPIYLPDPVNRQHPLNQSRTAWWLTLPGLDGGSTFYDLMGLYHGTLTNMTTSASGWRGATRPGGFGRLLFDGVDDNVTGPVILPTTNITVAGWVSPGTTGATQFLASNDNTSGTTGRAWQFRVNSAGKAQFIVFSGGPTSGSAVGTTTLSGAGEFHLCGTWDGVTIRIFVNGIQEGSTGFVGVASNVPTVGVMFGNGSASGSGGAGKLAGGLDDMGIWSQCLSAQGVWELYCLSRLGYPGVLKRIGPTLWAIPSGTLFTQTFAATCTGSGSMFKRAGAVRASASTGSASLNKRAGKTTAASSSGAASLLRTCGKAYSAACTGAATLGKSISRTLSAASSGAATMAKRVSRTVAASCTGAGAWIAAKVVLLGFIILNRFGFGDGGSTSSLGDGGSSSAKGDDGTFGGGTA